MDLSAMMEHIGGMGGMGATHVNPEQMSGEIARVHVCHLPPNRLHLFICYTKSHCVPMLPAMIQSPQMQQKMQSVMSNPRLIQSVRPRFLRLIRCCSRPFG
jgi:hypothetical protein